MSSEAFAWAAVASAGFVELGVSGAENVLVGPIQRLRGYAEKWRKGNHKFQLDWEVGHPRNPPLFTRDQLRRL